MYAQFLSNNQEEFDSSKERRSMKFFTLMAEELAIGKNNLQCRSHHQKMLKKFGSVEMIISSCLNSGLETKKEEIEKTKSESPLPEPN